MSDDTARPHGPKEPRARSSGHCVVLGASIAGLFAARVLSGTFDRVTVVDRDELPEADDNRRGVPQGRHAHAILPAGTRGLQQMFPGLLEEFEADGVPVVREPVEMHFAPGGHLLCIAPDEDLYEQGVFPSTFNWDHKHTFTIYKKSSFTPKSINVTEMLAHVPQHIGKR